MQYYKKLKIIMKKKINNVNYKKLYSDSYDYRAYKKFHTHSTTRFLLLKIFQFFQKDFEKYYSNVTNILCLENKLTKKDTLNHFMEVFQEFKLFLPKEYNNVLWGEFGKYFYYVWQTSRYHYDKKRKKENIFLEHSFIFVNPHKRYSYGKWLSSLEANIPNFNLIILFIKKEGI